MSECAATRKFCRVLESLGAMTYPLIGSGYAPPHWPDRIAVHERWRGFMEFKAHNGRLDPGQVQVLSMLRARGMPAWVLRFSEDETQIRIENEQGDVLVDWRRWGAILEELIEL